MHKLKHKISILGLERSYRVAETYEDNLKLNNEEGRADFEAIMQLMSEFLETL